MAKKNFFEEVKKTLRANSVELKFNLFDTLYKEFQNKKLDFVPTDVEVFIKPSYSDFCTIVEPKKIVQKKDLTQNKNKATLLHAIAHIEYSAIDLALDACYRFQDMPYEYYFDWMEVADDEIRHFNLIVKELEKYDTKYGSLPVHQGLFEASMKTLDFIPRMALIPRYMEANGLDANAMLIKRLQNFKDTKHIVELLQIILDEEIDHVKKGDRWYKYGCDKKVDFSCDYFKIVNSIYPNSFNTNKPINIEARKKAGFSDEEITYLVKNSQKR